MKIGKVTENVRKRSILQLIKTKRQEVINGAGPGEDCAIFSLYGAHTDECVSDPGQRDMHVITCTQGGPLSLFSVEILLQKCVNILAARGAEPVAVAMQILLPEDAEEPQLKGLMQAAEAFCGLHGMQIAQADAQVTAAVQEIFVTVTAYGSGAKAADAEAAIAAANPAAANAAGVGWHTVRAAKPGQDIVISKWIGLEGTAILADRHRERISERYPAWLSEEAADFRRYLSTVPEAAVALKSGVCAMHNLSEGGIFAGLWELAEGAGVGLNIDLKKLPIRQETVEVCNHLNVNPYELLSGGSLLMTAADGAALVAAFEEAGIPAAIVGRTTDGNDRIIRNEDEVRYLDRPHVDAIYEALRDALIDKETGGKQE